MPVPAIVGLVVGVLTFALLLVLLVAIIGQLKRLAGAVREFAGELEPALRGMQADAERARSRSEAIASEAESIREQARRRR